MKHLLSLAGLGGSGSVTALPLVCLVSTAAALRSADRRDRLRSVDRLLSGTLLCERGASSVDMQGSDLLVDRPR